MLALPPRDRPRPTGWTPPEVKEECHSGESKAELPIRVQRFGQRREIGYARWEVAPRFGN